MEPLRIPLAIAFLALTVGTLPTAADLSITGLQVAPRLDLRAEAGTGAGQTLRVMASEVDVRFSVNRNGEELVAFALGPNIETEMTGRARQMHFGNYYSVWNFGVDKPKVKLGQFVIPFGTLAEYDTHPLVLQTPYARTLGLRIDRGLEVDGLQGPWDWRFSLTSGDGRGRVDGSYAANLRLARDYRRGGDAYRLGFSALHGKQMPVFPINPMSLPMDDMGLTRADKDRLALDLDWLHGIDDIRAELVAGRDDHDFVNGQWLSWSHPFSYKTELTLQADRWQGNNGTAFGFGASLHQRLDDLSGLRLAYEPRWAHPNDMPSQFAGMVTLQYYRDFALSF